MGQKVHPTGFRLGIQKLWRSRWYSERDFSKLLHEDMQIRDYIKDKIFHAGITKIDLERAAKKIRVNIYSARPGIIIGKKGVEIEKLKGELQKMTDKEVYINICEVQRPEVDAQLIAENVCRQLERRISYRRAMKKSVSTALKLGAQGIKIACAGRLGGAEIARQEWYREGRVPLQTLRAEIEFGFAEAKTTYGIIGVKVWVFKGETLLKKRATYASS